MVPRAVRQTTGAATGKSSLSATSTDKMPSAAGDARSSSSNGGSAMSNDDFRKMLLKK